MKKYYFLAFCLFGLLSGNHAQTNAISKTTKSSISKNSITANSISNNRQATYCNPINLDYGYCPIPNFVQNGKHRATADPVMTVYDNKYFLFSTNQWGYWWSNDMKDWKFIPRKFLRPWNQV